MAQRIEAPTVTVTAGTTSSVPATTQLSWLPGIVRLIEVVVPPGPSGLVGFAIGHSQTVIIPRTSGQWIITDNERLNWDVEEYPVGAKWFVRAYNTDIYDHSLYFRFHLDEIPVRALSRVPLQVIVPVLDQVVPE